MFSWSSVSSDNSVVEAELMSAGFSSEGSDDVDDSHGVSMSSSSGGNSRLTTRSRTLIHLNTKHSFNHKPIQCESKKVAPPKTFCHTFTCVTTETLVIAQTYSYLYTIFGPFI